MQIKRSPGLRRSLDSSSEWLSKGYRYETEQDGIVLARRMDLASRCSRLVGSVPEISWQSTAEVVEVRQQRVRRLRVEPGPECAYGLLALAQDLDAMASWGMVHGDLNRKNILWTEEGYRLVDFEPVLCVRRTDGRTLLRGTAPYIHPDDLERNRISTLSDRLGFACLVEWVMGRVRRPAEAAPRLANRILGYSFSALSR